MVDLFTLGNIFLVLSLVPLGFLAYTLLSLEKLEIKVTHPRVIVESICFLVILMLGVFMR